MDTNILCFFKNNEPNKTYSYAITWVRLLSISAYRIIA